MTDSQGERKNLTCSLFLLNEWPDVTIGRNNRQLTEFMNV